MKIYNKSKLLVTIIFFVALLVTPILQVKAQTNLEGFPFQAGEIEDDIILTGDTIIIDGPIDGDVIAIGKTVQINSQIGGSLIAAGQDISIQGQVTGSAYVGGVKLEMGEDSVIGRSLYFIGARLITEPGSTITRDLTVLSVSASLSGQVGRELNTIIGLLDILINFRDNDTRNYIPENDNTGENSSGSPFLRFNSPAKEKFSRDGIMHPMSLDGLNKSIYLTDYAEIQSLQEAEEEPPVPTWLSSSINSFATLLIFGLLAIWIIPHWIENSSIQLKQKTFRSVGYGLIGVVLSINMIGVVLLLAAIIGVIGFFLGVILIWALAWSVWTLGFSSLAIATTLFGIFVFFISKVIVAYFIGSIILRKISPKLSKYKILDLLVGLLIYVILIAIPYIGWVIGIMVTALGIGSAFLAYLQYKKDKKSITTEDIQSIESTDNDSKALENDTEKQNGEFSTKEEKPNVEEE